MALQAVGKAAPYTHLVQLLQITEYGTAFYRLEQLARLGVTIRFDLQGWDGIARILASGTPVIIALRTSSLNYWPTATTHAVIVVGLVDEQVLLHDPALAHGPIAVPLLDCLIAWEEAHRLCAAVVRR